MEGWKGATGHSDGHLNTYPLRICLNVGLEGSHTASVSNEREIESV